MRVGTTPIDGIATKESGLDDPVSLRSRDPEDMVGIIVKSGEQVRRAAIAMDEMPLFPMNPDGVVIVGMGGSGIAGDTLASLSFETAQIPVISVKGPRLPGWMTCNTVLICVSYIGDAEEIVEAARRGIEMGARVFIVAGGPPLVDMAEYDGVELVRLPRVEIQPRAAFWTLVISVIALASKVSVVDVEPEQFREAAEALDESVCEFGPATPTSVNFAKQAAVQLIGKLPIIIGTGVFGGVAATRFRTQCNENAKAFAISNVMPEAAHNEIMALENGDFSKLELVLFRDCATEDPMDEVRLAAMCAEAGIEQPIERCATSTASLPRLASLISFCDFVTTYLALLKGVNPTPVATISRIKQAVDQAHKAYGKWDKRPHA